MFREIDAEYLMVDGDDTYPAEYGRDMAHLVLEKHVDMVIGDRLSSTYFTEKRSRSTISVTAWCDPLLTAYSKPISAMSWLATVPSAICLWRFSGSVKRLWKLKRNEHSRCEQRHGHWTFIVQYRADQTAVVQEAPIPLERIQSFKTISGI